MDMPVTPVLPVSKVLVLDGDAASRARIGAFCRAQRLQAHKVREDTILQVLRSNVDLGAIFLSERVGDRPDAGIALGQRIHAMRPELPLFLRREADAAQPVPEGFSAAYTVDTLASLEPVVQGAIFSLVYPHALVRGIHEITQAAFQSQFRGMVLEIDTPCIVRDRLIYGEIFTLIPIESHWCRGYMTLQTEEAALQRLVHAAHTAIDPSEADDFRSLNGILGELTNLVWGAFKNRYDDRTAHGPVLSQVPIVVNHLHRYISFGSSDPQLCFKCTLRAADGAGFEPVVIHQRFVFSLGWSPEDFRENDHAAESLLASGELELF